MLVTKEVLPINIIDFRKAFKAFDPSGQGWIKISALVYMLKRVDPPFSEDEIHNLLIFAGSKKSPDKLYYEDYLIGFYEFVNSHLKKLHKSMLVEE